MRTLLGVCLALSISAAGCGGTHYDDSTSDDDWSSSQTSGTSTTSAGVDAGVDSGVDAGDPVRNRAMALFARSCTPCHRHTAPIDADAIARGVFLETDEEILALARSYTVGQTPTGLRAIVAQRAEGYELMVGPSDNLPMPPRGSSYAPWTQEEAGQVMAWFRATTP